MSAPLAVPASPSSSSKRSRSRDSIPSVATSYHTPSANTPFLTPSASAQSLATPSNAGSPSALEPAAADLTPYPAFLRLSPSDVQARFQLLDDEQRKRGVYVGLQYNAAGPSSKWARFSPEVMANRNRYGNVEPFLHNSVRLRLPEGHNDYINASPITLESTKSKTVHRYIATQGPKPETFSHLYRMIWHETSSPSVVVMLTPTHEGNNVKCFQYYPLSTATPYIRINPYDEFEDGFIHDLNLTSLTESDEARAQVRELDMTTEDGSETRKIWHLLFADWPDFGAPKGDNKNALIRLIALSREKNAENPTSPRIVHCSAGVGRSGTFIALDWLLQELEEGSLDNLDDIGNDENNENNDNSSLHNDPVWNIVNILREQRMMMVQAEQQLALIYDILREQWRERWRQLHPDEAHRLGMVDVIREPKLKRQKSNRMTDVEIRVSGNEDDGTEDEDEDANEKERAQLQAELMESEMQFEKGKT